MAQKQKPKIFKANATNNNNNNNANKEMDNNERNTKAPNTNAAKTKLKRQDTVKNGEKLNAGRLMGTEKLNKSRKNANTNKAKVMDDVKNQESTVTILPAQAQNPHNIDKYTPESISRLLCSVNKERCLPDDQTAYVVNFLNQLKNNDLTVLKHNLQLIKKARPLNDDALYWLLTLLLKSSVAWSSEQINLILNLYYDLEHSQKHNRFQPEMVMHVHVERLCPYQMAYFHDCMTNSWKCLTPERYEYLLKFLSNLKRFNNREADDYFTFLRVNGFLKRDKLDNLIGFLTETKRQWKPHNYEKLELLLKRQVAKKVVLNVVNPKGNVNKKSMQQPKKRNRSSRRSIVHHQDTQTFSQTINYLTNGGILNKQRLNILNDFVQELLQMNHNGTELINYLATLKCRRILNNAANYYLKNLIQEKAIPIDTHQQQILINALQKISDKKRPRNITVSLLNLKSRSDLFQKFNTRNSVIVGHATIKPNDKVTTDSAIVLPTTSTAAVAATAASTSSATAATTAAASTLTSTRTSASNTTPTEKMRNNNSVIMSDIDLYNNDIDTEKEFIPPIPSSIQEGPLLKIGDYAPPKMSDQTRKKVKRFFHRLRATIYFATRLTYYQKIFRAII